MRIILQYRTFVACERAHPQVLVAIGCTPASFAIFTLGSLLAAWGPNFAAVMVGRILQAICTGMVMPMVITVIMLVFPREKRGAAMVIIPSV